MKHSFLARCVALGLVGLSAACTMKDQEAPSLTGPSEFATSITISLTPDVLKQDGASQSMVTITARGPSGGPLSGVPLRAEIRVNNTPADFGALSARDLTTGSDGRASLRYTAPASQPFALDHFIDVNIAITPVGNDFGNSVTRSATVRVLSTGIVIPAGDLVPNIEFAPSAPTENQAVLFDASASSGSIVSYSWDFGDGARASGRSTTHSYDEARTYLVTLTIADQFGRMASASKSVPVGAASGLTAAFTSSPAAPTPGQPVFFNASQSTPGSNRRITSYSWDFGDGQPAQSGVQTQHTFNLEGVYTVTLTVTDDSGRQAVKTGTVTVKIPVATP